MFFVHFSGFSVPKKCVGKYVGEEKLGNDIFHHTFPTYLFSNIFTLLRLHIAFKVSTPNVCIKNRVEEEDPEAQINDCHADLQHANDGSNESFD